MTHTINTYIPENVELIARPLVADFYDKQKNYVSIKDIDLECDSLITFREKILPIFDQYAHRVSEYESLCDYTKPCFTKDYIPTKNTRGKILICYELDNKFELVVNYYKYNDDNNTCNVVILSAPNYWPEKAIKLEEALLPYRQLDHGIITNQVWALKQTKTGFEITSIGEMHDELITDNYSEIVCKKIQHLVDDLNSDEPCGKLNIINGLPGTGKTRLVRGLISSQNNIDFVLMAPEQITNLNSTAIIEALLTHKVNQERRICLVLEDADHCLVERMSDNMSSLSTLLNSSDGIVGSLLDLRIIATTNSSHVEFDKAVLRPGRLCTHIEINELPTEQCQARYNILTDNKGIYRFNKPATIADVYKRIYDFKHEQ